MSPKIKIRKDDPNVFMVENLESMDSFKLYILASEDKRQMKKVVSNTVFWKKDQVRVK